MFASGTHQPYLLFTWLLCHACPVSFQRKKSQKARGSDNKNAAVDLQASDGTQWGGRAGNCCCRAKKSMILRPYILSLIVPRAMLPDSLRVSNFLPLQRTLKFDIVTPSLGLENFPLCALVHTAFSFIHHTQTLDLLTWVSNDWVTCRNGVWLPHQTVFVSGKRKQLD